MTLTLFSFSLFIVAALVVGAITGLGWGYMAGVQNERERR